MTDLRARLGEVSAIHQWYLVGNIGVPGMPDDISYKCPCGWRGEEPKEHVAEVLLSLPGVVVVEREVLAEVIAGGIQSYAGGESEAYSYHGDGSALEAMERLDREASGIAAYALTSSLLKGDRDGSQRTT
jgi:hypothetical protein